MKCLRIPIVSMLVVLSAGALSGCASRSKLRAAEEQVLELQNQVADLETELGSTAAELEKTRARTRELEARLGELAEREKIHLERIDLLTVVRLPETVLFRSGSADITADGKRVLNDLSDVLHDFPDYDIRVEGHTDNKAIKEEFRDKFFSNWELSTARATTVLRHLLSTQQIAPERLSAVGYGENHPIAANDTPEGRARNRRVEFHIKKSEARDLQMEPGENPF